MKKRLLALCLLSSSVHVLAENPADALGRRLDTPALRQFSQQANCAVQNATEKLGTDVIKQSVLLAAAESCVSPDFTPELGGLPANLVPPTRSERVQSIATAAGRRIKLCEQLGITEMDRSAKCAQVFVKN